MLRREKRPTCPVVIQCVSTGDRITPTPYPDQHTPPGPLLVRAHINRHQDHSEKRGDGVDSAEERHWLVRHEAQEHANNKPEGEETHPTGCRESKHHG